MKYIALDVETANPKRSSLCEIGIAEFNDGKMIRSKSSLVRPPSDNYHWMNNKIHQIPKEDLMNALYLDVVWPTYKDLFKGDLVCHNSSFDLSVVRRSLETYSLGIPVTKVFCTLRICKSLYPDLISYKLEYLLKHFEIEHGNLHRAENDAVACGLLFSKLLELHGVEELANLKNRANSTITDTLSEVDVTSDSLNDKDFVFTGTLHAMSRKDASTEVLTRNGRVNSNVSQSTDYLVVGDQDFSKFTDGKQSTKMKKAVALKEKGSNLQLISEHDFLRMLVN